MVDSSRETAGSVWVVVARDGSGCSVTWRPKGSVHSSLKTCHKFWVLDLIVESKSDVVGSGSSWRLRRLKGTQMRGNSGVGGASNRPSGRAGKKAHLAERMPSQEHQELVASVRRMKALWHLT